MSTRKTQWLANCWPDPLRPEVARAYEQLSETAEFRLILEDLARYAGLRTTSFVPGQSDQTAFNEGQRDLVFHLLERETNRPHEKSRTPTVYNPVLFERRSHEEVQMISFF